MPLINCKIYLELNWRKDCVMSTIIDTTFRITNTKLYVPIVTLSSKDSVKLVKLLEEGFKRLVCWNEYQTRIETKDLDNNNFTIFSLDESFQGVRKMFVLAFDDTDNKFFQIMIIIITHIFHAKFVPNFVARQIISMAYVTI